MPGRQSASHHTACTSQTAESARATVSKALNGQGGEGAERVGSKDGGIPARQTPLRRRRAAKTCARVRSPCGAAWSRTTLPDKPTGMDAPPHIYLRTTPLMPCRRATRMASPPTTGQSLVAKYGVVATGRSTRECLAPPRLDPTSSPELRYQRARPRPDNSTSYHCARGERIPTDLARATPSPAPPSPPLFPPRATPAARWENLYVYSQLGSY